MSTLLIALNPAGPALAEWAYAVVDNSGTLSRHGSASAAQLPAAAQVAVMVPAHALSWHRVLVPKAQPARMRAALEGLLEEKLLDEPANLHFALEPGAKPGTNAWVVVCDKAWLTNELKTLHAAGKPVARIVPEAAPLQIEGAAQLHVSGPEHLAYATWATDQGVQRWPLAGFAHAGLDAADADISAEPAVAALAEQVLQHKVRIQSAPQAWAQALGSDWNLAQFDLRALGQDTPLQRVRNVARTLWAAPQWRALRWAAVVLLGVNLLGLNAFAWTQSRELAAKRESVRSLLTQTFPQVKLVVDAPRQMQREVAALRQATGGASARDLDVMLTAFSAAAPEKHAQTAIEYVAGELTLKGVSFSPDELAQANQRLGASGYALRAEGSNVVMRVEGEK